VGTWAWGGCKAIRRRAKVGAGWTPFREQTRAPQDLAFYWNRGARVRAGAARRAAGNPFAVGCVRALRARRSLALTSSAREPFAAAW